MHVKCWVFGELQRILLYITPHGVYITPHGETHDRVIYVYVQLYVTDISLLVKSEKKKRICLEQKYRKAVAAAKRKIDHYEQCIDDLSERVRKELLTASMVATELSLLGNCTYQSS